MADYPSALTGAQMDIALLDVAQHNSEAWAVGTRSGNAVSSGDETYNNNSWYWAKESKTWAGVAQGAIPSGTAGAVFFDRAQSLTDSQKEQARANIAAANSNRNLLDNPWWGSGEVVNQRGTTSGSTTHAVYCIDRWFTSYGNALGTWSLGTTGITLSAASGTYALLQQNLPTSLATLLTGKTVTCSYMDASGNIHSGTVASLNWSENPVAVSYGNTRVQLMSNYGFRVTTREGSTDTIRAVKLELGAYSTLINDVPPDYGEELRKCKQYYRVINCTSRGRLFIGIGFGSNGVEVPNVFGVGNEMRISTPDVASTGTFYVNAGSDIAVTSVTKNTTNTELSLSFNVASGVTAHQMYSIIGTSGAKIEFKADL